MQKLLKKIIGLVFISAITACTPPQPAPAPALHFNQYPKINVHVADIRVIEEYKSPNSAPNIEHLMAYSPAAAVKIWVKDRLRTTGTNKILQVTIVNAPVIATELPKTKGLQGAFTIDQDKRYDARLEVEMRIYGDGAISEADSSVSVSRSITIPENSTVNSRRIGYEQMISDMMKMFNDKMELNMRNFFGNNVNFSNN
jgi:hypothetical protein